MSAHCLLHTKENVFPQQHEQFLKKWCHDYSQPQRIKPNMLGCIKCTWSKELLNYLLYIQHVISAGQISRGVEEMHFKIKVKFCYYTDMQRHAATTTFRGPMKTCRLQTVGKRDVWAGISPSASVGYHTNASASWYTSRDYYLSVVIRFKVQLGDRLLRRSQHKHFLELTSECS